VKEFVVADSAATEVVTEISTSSDELTTTDDEDDSDVAIGSIEEARDAAMTDKPDVALTTALGYG